MHAEVAYESKDELGRLADNLRFVLKTLSEYIAHICSRSANKIVEEIFLIFKPDS